MDANTNILQIGPGKLNQDICKSYNSLLALF